MTKVLVIARDFEWNKVDSNIAIVEDLSAAQFSIADGKLRVYYIHKYIEPDAVVYRKGDLSPADKRFLSALHHFKGPVLDRPEVIEQSDNIYWQLEHFKRHGLPVPETYASFYGGQGIDLDSLEYPLVVKTDGLHRGLGKALARDKESLDEIMGLAYSEDKRFFLQEFVPAVSDFRVLVIGGEVIGTIKREHQHWMKSGDPLPKEVPVRMPELEEIALKATELLKADIVGADILETEEGRQVLLEANTRPGFAGFGRKPYDATMDLVKKKLKG